MNVRAAAPADAALISALVSDVQSLHAEALPFFFKPYSAGTFPPETVSAWMANPANIFLIAEVDGAPAGYAYAELRSLAEDGFRLAFTSLHLHHISVRQAQRGSGCGAALIAALKDLARERGASRLTLDVWSFNAPARGFFASQGFTPFMERLWAPIE